MYIVECSDHSYYTGSALDLVKRIETHNKAKGAKYTRGRLPVRLRYSEFFETMGEALTREKEVQSLTRNGKEKLFLKTKKNKKKKTERLIDG